MIREWKLLLIVCVTLCYGKSIGPKQETKSPFKFEDVLPNQFGQRGFGGTWISGDEITLTINGDFSKQNIETAENTTILTSAFIRQYWNNTGPSFTFSADLSRILVRYSNRQIFRHSTVSKFSVISLPELEVTEIADGEEIQIAFFAPVGKGLAYIESNNIYYNDFEGMPIIITSDGIPGVIYNGIPDWVYEEEVLGSDAASWFSPDGRNLAYVRFNDEDVKEAVYEMYGEGDRQYPEEIHLRYPKAGTTNPTVALILYNLDGSLPRELAIPIDKVTEDHILGSVFWINNEKLGTIWMNRRQNRGVFVSYDASTYAMNEIFEINEPNGWIDVNTPKCDVNAVCYFINNESNWPKLTSINTANGELHYYTSAGMTVLSIYGVNSEGVVYFAATPAANESFNRHVYSVSISTLPTCLTCDLLTPENNACTYATASFSKDLSHHSVTCSGPDPAMVKVFKTEGSEVVRDWEDNTNLRTKLAGYDEPKKRIFHVPVEGDFNATVMLMIPSHLDFDAIDEETIKKYPLLIRVYGGPGSVRIASSFGVGFHYYQITSKDVIYAEIDGRGTGQNGIDLMFSINNNLGTFEMDDQIAVTKYLVDNFKFIDPKRVGIWGWSYGGYATAMTLAKDTEHVFKCGVSVAPVTSWRFYDTIYTERYMGIDSNALNYNTSDVSTPEHVKVLGQHDFFLIHGNADDNVHYQQSMVLARELQLQDIMFEQLSYPNEAHSISGAQPHLYHALDHFWDQCFKP